ncbi:hypothetical protein FOMPIDRAFT_1119230 [Fomitopsis schrenkii]|uniref:Major facilitator superfamily (MFS) profile domain-containing protein n=1 Tax=Fomitopsis schrenkii TaxID=2126942 RepID=S8EAM4_FOMSC|nr:hypothetical protein FOMPIDRAFT_1119230 [Fomitopsis schrenkii]
MERNIAQLDAVPTENEKDTDLERLYAPALSPEQQRRLWRKVDMRILPVLSALYLCCYLDRGNAKLEGLTTQLDLTGNKYNVALVCLTMFSRWLPGITIAWGIVLTLMGIVKNYPQLVAVRCCLGIAEAGILPGATYYLTLWYPRHMLQLRIALFWGGSTVAGAFSGLIAYGVSFMSGTAGLLGWSWLFIIEGIVTVLVGIVAFFVLVDFPDTATFITDEERAFIAWSRSKSSPEEDSPSEDMNEHLKLRHWIAALSDWQVWMHIVLYLCICTPLNGITLFLPFGYGTAVSQLLTIPPYMCALILLIVFAWWSDHVKMRSPFLFVCLLMGLVGFSINISNASNGAKYFGTFFCIAGLYAAFPGTVAWLGNNLAGQHKRAIGMAVHLGVGNMNGIIASNLYLSTEAPRYILGHSLAMMFIGIGLIIIPVIVALYRRINARRDKEVEAGGKSYTGEEVLRVGDRAPSFRYIL